MNKFVRWLNPINKLGINKYSFSHAVIGTAASYFISHILINLIFGSVQNGGFFIIYISSFLVIYFSFRDGIRGGLGAFSITIFYYIYLIFSGSDDPERIRSGLITTASLSAMFLTITFTVGWLKQKIDSLIETEADAKKRLQTIIKQLPVGVLITDAAGTVIEVNEQIEKLINRKIHKSQKIQELVTDNRESNDQTTFIFECVQKVIETSRAVNNAEYSLVLKNKKVRYLQISAVPIHNMSNQVIAITAIIIDITEQKDLESLKDEFIGIASHELKTPLTSIKGYTQILERIIEEMGNDKAKQYLNKTNKYINRLSSLITDLLDVSRIQAGKLEFNYEYYDFDTMIREAVESFQPFTKDFSIQIQGKTNAKIYGDPVRTEQVLNNLLSNAIKYSLNGKKVIIQLKSQDNSVLVSVKDYGIGIAKQQHKHIFKRFYRAQESSKNISGLGIGLYISSEIIKRQGGRIWVESVPDVGSTFYFSLPIKKRKIT